MTSDEPSAVTNYRALVLARMGTILERHEFAASDDSAALERARHYANRHHVELWQVNRLVGLLNPSEHANDKP
jgi:hypothetical protein